MANWCEIPDVNLRLEAIAGKGIADDDIEARIDQATTFLKTQFLGCYSATIVTGWDTSCPPMVKDLCAVIAASFVKSHFIPDYQRSQIEKYHFELVDKVISGKSDLLDASGSVIVRATNRAKFNKSGKTRTFTTGNAGDDTVGNGTLDDFGPNQEHIEGQSEY